MVKTYIETHKETGRLITTAMKENNVFVDTDIADLGTTLWLACEITVEENSSASSHLMTTLLSTQTLIDRQSYTFSSVSN